MPNKIPTMLHCLNNGDYDYVLQDFYNLSKEEVWLLFIELITTYQIARSGTEFEYNHLQEFLRRLLQNEPLIQND